MTVDAINGDGVRLRALRPDDVDDLVAGYSDPVAQRFLPQVPAPFNRRFAEAFASTDAERRLRETFEAGQKVGVRGSPAFFLNGRRLAPPPRTEADLERAILAAVRRME